MDSKVVFSKMNIISVKGIFSIVSPKAKSFPFCPILFHRIKMKKRFQMEDTNRCQAMNSPRGEIKLTQRRQKTEKYFFYQIFVLPKFTLLYFSILRTVSCDHKHNWINDSFGPHWQKPPWHTEHRYHKIVFGHSNPMGHGGDAGSR